MKQYLIFLKCWFNKENIFVISWLNCGLDLNGIENMWGHLFHHAFKSDKKYYSSYKLEAAIMEN